MNKLIKIATVVVLAVALMGCVSKKRYNELLDYAGKNYDEARNCEANLAAAETRIKELEDELERLKKQKTKIEADTARLSQELQRVQDDCNAMHEQNMQLIDKLKTSKSQEEAQELIAEIQSLQAELMAREDALFKAERDLADKQKELAAKQAELEQQNAKVLELQNMLAEKDKKLQDLKDKVKNALTAYEGDGLTITSKNGRIYVSLDEKLLFKSGSWTVDSRGESAISKLATVLGQNKDINIVVEGHTDDVPFGGSGQIIDNWDLSVKRATAIVRILTKSGEVEPSRVSASGRGEFCPVDTANTAEARKKNRRSEIILTPNLDELMKIFD